MTRRLYRSRTDSVIGGVAGGVAEYLDVDPSIVRIAWAILAIVTGGILFVLYLVMWVVVPEPPEGAPAVAPAADAHEGSTGGEPAQPATQAVVRRNVNGGLIFGLILIGVGAWFLLDEFIPDLRTDLLWPAALVIVGLVLLVTALRRG